MSLLKKLLSRGTSERREFYKQLSTAELRLSRYEAELEKYLRQLQALTGRRVTEVARTRAYCASKILETHAWGCPPDSLIVMYQFAVLSMRRAYLALLQHFSEIYAVTYRLKQTVHRRNRISILIEEYKIHKKDAKKQKFFSSSVSTVDKDDQSLVHISEFIVSPTLLSRDDVCTRKITQRFRLVNDALQKLNPALRTIPNVIFKQRELRKMDYSRMIQDEVVSTSKFQVLDEEAELAIESLITAVEAPYPSISSDSEASSQRLAPRVFKVLHPCVRRAFMILKVRHAEFHKLNGIKTGPICNCTWRKLLPSTNATGSIIVTTAFSIEDANDVEKQETIREMESNPVTDCALCQSDQNTLAIDAIMALLLTGYIPDAKFDHSNNALQSPFSAASKHSNPVAQYHHTTIPKGWDPCLSWRRHLLMLDRAKVQSQRIRKWLFEQGNSAESDLNLLSEFDFDTQKIRAATKSIAEQLLHLTFTYSKLRIRRASRDKYFAILATDQRSKEGRMIQRWCQQSLALGYAPQSFIKPDKPISQSGQEAVNSAAVGENPDTIKGDNIYRPTLFASGVGSLLYTFDQGMDYLTTTCENVGIIYQIESTSEEEYATSDIISGASTPSGRKSSYCVESLGANSESTSTISILNNSAQPLDPRLANTPLRSTEHQSETHGTPFTVTTPKRDGHTTPKANVSATTTKKVPPKKAGKGGLPKPNAVTKMISHIAQDMAADYGLLQRTVPESDSDKDRRAAYQKDELARKPLRSLLERIIYPRIRTLIFSGVEVVSTEVWKEKHFTTDAESIKLPFEAYDPRKSSVLLSEVSDSRGSNFLSFLKSVTVDRYFKAVQSSSMSTTNSPKTASGNSTARTPMGNWTDCVEGSAADVLAKRDRVWLRKQSFVREVSTSEILVEDALIAPLPGEFSAVHPVQKDKFACEQVMPRDSPLLFSYARELLRASDEALYPELCGRYLSDAVGGALLEEAYARGAAAFHRSRFEDMFLQTHVAAMKDRTMPKLRLPRLDADELTPLVSLLLVTAAFKRPHACLTYATSFGSVQGKDEYFLTSLMASVAKVCETIDRPKAARTLPTNGTASFPHHPSSTSATPVARKVSFGSSLEASGVPPEGSKYSANQTSHIKFEGADYAELEEKEYMAYASNMRRASMLFRSAKSLIGTENLGEQELAHAQRLEKLRKKNHIVVLEQPGSLSDDNLEIVMSEEDVQDHTWKALDCPGTLDSSPTNIQKDNDDTTPSKLPESPINGASLGPSHSSKTEDLYTLLDLPEAKETVEGSLPSVDPVTHASVIAEKSFDDAIDLIVDDLTYPYERHEDYDYCDVDEDIEEYKCLPGNEDLFHHLDDKSWYKELVDLVNKQDKDEAVIASLFG